MSKFKVGDKVRTAVNLAAANERGRHGITSDCYWDYGTIRTIESLYATGSGLVLYKVSNDPLSFSWPEYALVSAEPRREFIVIRRSGAETIAELRHDREVIKSAKATCAPSDTFDLDTGAKLAFDRLMGREEPKRESLADIFAKLEKPAPQPAHRFKVGDRIQHRDFGLGTVIEIINYVDGVPYHVKADSGTFHNHWAEKFVSPAPAPEPPKFYTGKVFAEKSDDAIFASRDGRVFEFVDGKCINSVQNDLMDFGAMFPTIDRIRKEYSSTTWHEVKSDV